jgi:hypothetical protein
MDAMKAKYTQELLEASKKVREEPPPDGSTIYDHIFSEKNLVGGER